MNKTLLIVTDLGRVRSCRETQIVADRQPRLELFDQVKLESAHRKLSDPGSDLAGRVPRGGGVASISGDLSSGESHTSKAEQSRRLISQSLKQ